MALIGSVNNWGTLQGQINSANGYLTGVISSAALMGGQVVGMRGLPGEKGDPGDTGNGIASVSKTGTVGLVDTYTITYTNGTTSTFTVTNGKDGTDGVDGRDGVDGHSPTITTSRAGKTVTILSDGESIGTVEDGADGSDGQDGQDGADGFSPIANVSKAGDTATITITDGIGTTTATVKDGKDGQDGADGQDGQDGHTPVITASKVGDTTTVYVDGVAVATINDGENPYHDLGNIDPSDYDDDLEEFLNTLTDNGNYKFVWEDGDDFEYFVEIQSLVENGNGYVLQHYWYTEEGAKYQYNRSAFFEDGECTGSDIDNYMTQSDANSSYATKNHSHYENKSVAKTVWDYCDDDLAFDNGKPYILYADTLNDKNWLIERYSAMRNPAQRYIRLYDLGDASHFYLRSGLYSAGTITWGSWKEYPSGGGGGGDIVYATSNDSASTVSKTATIVSGTLTTLTSGVQAIVKFAETNTASSPTLNIGGTGAKSIKRYGTTAVGQNQNESWVAGSPVLLVYDGTNWVISGWLNTTYSGGTAGGITTGTDNLNYIWSPKQIHDGIVSLADANVQSDWNEADNTKDDYIKNKPTIPSNTSDLNNDSGFITSPNVVYATCSTAGGTAAKTATIVSGTLTSLHEGDQVIVRFTNANSVASPTLKVGTTDAKSIRRYGTSAPSTSAATSWNADSPVLFVYDGTYWRMIGWLNSTYSEITEANITSGSGSSTGLVSGRRVKKAVETFAPVTSVNGQTGAVTIDSDVYIATYNVTEYSDILTAISQGKEVVCAYTDTFNGVTVTYYAPLLTYSNGDNPEYIIFSCIDYNLEINIVVDDTDTWVANNDTLVMDTDITGFIAEDSNGDVDISGAYKTNGKYIGSYIKVTGTSTGTSTLTTSSQKIVMDTEIEKKGNAFYFSSSLTGGGIHLYADGTVLFSGKIRVGQDYNGSDIVFFEIWVNSTAVYTHKYRVPPNMTTPNQHITLPTIPLTVSAGDRIYLYAYNATAGRGTVRNDETELYATYIAPTLT